MLALVQITGENVSIFIDGSILDSHRCIGADFIDLSKATVQEIDLKVEGPSCHIMVEITQVGILVYGFVESNPTVMFRKLLGQRCFSASNVSRYGDVFDGGHGAQI
jgi:hypothetical protein